MPREEGRQAGEESRANGCGSRTGFGQIRPLRGRARDGALRERGWSPPPEPGGPVTSVVRIMPPMPAQPLGHEGFAQAPPFQRRLNRAPLDDFKPGSRATAGPAAEPSCEPELTQRDGASDNRQGHPLDRLDAPAGLAGDAQQQPMPPGGLDRGQARRSRRPKGPVDVRTRASGPPGKSDPRSGRCCSYRRVEPPDARTCTGNGTTDRQLANVAPRRTADEGPSAPHGRTPARRNGQRGAARRPKRCPHAASAAIPALSRFAPIQPTDPAFV